MRSSLSELYIKADKDAYTNINLSLSHGSWYMSVCVYGERGQAVKEGAIFSILSFFPQCKAEQPLKDIELQEKEAQRD